MRFPFSLVGTLRLGIDTEGSNGALWWPAPDPASLDLQTFDRAVAVSRTCDPREGWPFLGFALAGPECLELAESHPALACLLAKAPRVDGCYRADIPAEKRTDPLRNLARRPRRETLAALDFPATESMVRLLGKVSADRLNLESLRLLRDLRLAPRAAKALRHLPRFGSGLLPIAVRRKLWPHAGPQLLREAAEERDDGLYLRDWLETGVVRPEAVRWARDRARQRHRELLRLLAETTDPGEHIQLLAELARLRVGEPPGS